MSSRGTSSTSRSAIPPAIDYIDLTTESPVHRSSRTIGNSGTRHQNLHKQAEAMLAALDFLKPSKTRSGCGSRDISTRRNRTSTRTRTRSMISNKSKNDGYNQCNNEVLVDETIELDDNSLTKNSGPWCINDSNKVGITVLSCPICFVKLTATCKPMTTRCGHIFCEECLYEALKREKKCPICRAIVIKKSCTKLYF